MRDNIAESDTVSHQKHSLEDAAGNYVALDLGSGRIAFYEHLKPGSVRVKSGERVRRGQVIASLGFTGDSTGPHLHFHVADGVSPLASEGLPYVFESFRVMGAYSSLENFGRQAWQPLPGNFQSERKRELPAPNTVIIFGPPER